MDKTKEEMKADGEAHTHHHHHHHHHHVAGEQVHTHGAPEDSKVTSSGKKKASEKMYDKEPKMPIGANKEAK